MKINRLVIILAAALLIVLGLGSYLLATDQLTSILPFQTSIRNTETLSDSDEIEDIEDDLEETDIEEVDDELDDIDDELAEDELEDDSDDDSGELEIED